MKTYAIRRPLFRVAVSLLLAASGVASMTGCAPLLIGGAMVSGGLVATDRRTAGTQLEDQSIDLKAGARLRDLATLGRIEVTSFNRIVLLTGEVPAEADRLAVEKTVAALENVRSVVNELAVMSNAGLGTRSNDTLLSAKVKASLVDAKDVQSNAFKVVSERGVIYLMGRVTEREASRGAEIARAISGVQKVVRVFEIISDEDLAALGQVKAAK